MRLRDKWNMIRREARRLDRNQKAEKSEQTDQREGAAYANVNCRMDAPAAKAEEMFQIRTDLALEEKESFPGDGGEVAGVSLQEWFREDTEIKLTEVKILDEKGSKAMGKPVGTYITLEADDLWKKDEDYHYQVSEELANQIRQLLDVRWYSKSIKRRDPSVLAVGLGNPSVTPDSLGPRVLNNLQITRHLREEYGEDYCRSRGIPVLSGLIPGVMAQTGMETSEILKGVIKETKPDLLLVIDALAARSVRRLGTTIQLTDTGIHPGSGVGNHRHSLTEESLGIPVLAIGVPTVVGAASIVHDTIGAMIGALSSQASTKGLGDYIEQISPQEQYQLIRELLEPEFRSLYVTPPDIDETVKQLSFTISEGIHQAFFQ